MFGREWGEKGGGLAVRVTIIREGLCHHQDNWEKNLETTCTAQKIDRSLSLSDRQYRGQEGGAEVSMKIRTGCIGRGYAKSLNLARHVSLPWTRRR